MSRINQHKVHSRSGIALIVVLGFIAMLAILAVSLMVTMRIERLATSSYADTSKARHYAFAAMNRALEDIDDDMFTSGIRYPPATPYSTPAGGGVIQTNLFSDQADLFIPGAEYPNPFPTQIRMQDVVVNGSVVGRIGYYAVNSSGLLDANLIGGKVRGLGREAAEIPVSPSLLDEVYNAGNFLDGRSNYWRRFETLPEMFYLGVGNGSFRTNIPPISLFPFSMFREDLNPDGEAKIYIGGTTNDLMTNKTDIVAALQACNIPRPFDVFTNLLDYVDTDYIPQNLQHFCTESVPMINEVIVSNTITRALQGTNIVYTHRVFLTVETWYPFPGSFSAAQLTFPPPITFPVCVPNDLKPNPVSDLKSTAAPVITHNPFSYEVSRYSWEKSATNVTFPASGALGIQARLTGPLEVRDSASLVVDRVDLSGLSAGSLQLAAPGAVNGNAGASKGVSVLDPRLNHELARWSPELVTPKAQNDQVDTLDGEGVSTMYVRDFPLGKSMPDTGKGSGLGSVAELGFLSVGDSWRTIALYNTPNGGRMHPVLDYFTVNTNRTRSGLVNINSAHTSVLASAFYEVPIEAYPGGGGSKVTVAAAQSLAGNIIQNLHPSGRYATNRSISVVGEFNDTLMAHVNGQLTSPVLTNDANREALIRNTHGLLGARQNLFTVFAYGQSITAGGATGAEARAVSILWRDPEEEAGDGGSLNKTVMRLFKWL